VNLDLILIGLACSLEPIPLTGFILTLSTEHGTKKGLFFIFGWLLSLALVIGLTLGITAGKPPAPSTEPSEAVLAAQIAIGVGLIVFAWRYRLRAPKAHTEPSWMKRVDTMSVWAAMVLAFLLQPWGLVAAGALEISKADTSKPSDVVGIVLFALLASLSLFVMEGYALLAPEAARIRLTSLRQWMNVHRTEVIVYLSVIIGLWLIGKSTYSLVN
jgi:threonine/homoserine/homoserine lactone efflux protein